MLTRILRISLEKKPKIIIERNKIFIVNLRQILFKKNKIITILLETIT
jgi:hypothetical protein